MTLSRTFSAIMFCTGAIFLYFGIRYLLMKKENPDIPNKIYAAAVLCIVMGVGEIGLGVWLMMR